MITATDFLIHVLVCFTAGYALAKSRNFTLATLIVFCSTYFVFTNDIYKAIAETPSSIMYLSAILALEAMGIVIGKKSPDHWEWELEDNSKIPTEVPTEVPQN